jgi:hypothetical protein
VHPLHLTGQGRENDDKSRSFKTAQIFSILNLLHLPASVFSFEFQVCTIDRADGRKSVRRAGAGVGFRVEGKTLDCKRFLYLGRSNPN